MIVEINTPLAPSSHLSKIKISGVKKTALISAFILFLAMGVHGEEIDYSKISEAKSARINNLIIRYIRMYGESCAVLQTINPKGGREITSTKNICSLNGKSFKTDFADAYFENVYFSDNGVHLTLSTTSLEPIGEQKMECFVPIKDGSINTMTCEDIAKP